MCSQQVHPWLLSALLNFCDSSSWWYLKNTSRVAQRTGPLVVLWLHPYLTSSGVPLGLQQEFRIPHSVYKDGNLWMTESASHWVSLVVHNKTIRTHCYVPFKTELGKELASSQVLILQCNPSVFLINIILVGTQFIRAWIFPYPYLTDIVESSKTNWLKCFIADIANMVVMCICVCV